MPEVTALNHGTAILPDAAVDDALVLLEGDRIAYAGPFDEGRIPAGARHVDASGAFVIPGLIDTHVHGTHGDDVMSCGPEGLRRISQRFCGYATTAWLPSTISARHVELVQAIRDCVEGQRLSTGGAEIVGIHVEGPYINLKRKGALFVRQSQTSLQEILQRVQALSKCRGCALCLPCCPATIFTLLELRLSTWN